MKSVFEMDGINFTLFLSNNGLGHFEQLYSFYVLLLYLMGPVWLCNPLIEKERAGCFASHCFAGYILFILPLDDIGRLCSVIIAHP